MFICKALFISHIVYCQFLLLVNVPYQPPPGYYPNNTDTGYQENYIPSYGSVHSTAIIVPEIILVGGCPACRVCIDFLLFECYYICLHMLQNQKIDIRLT